MRSLIALSLLVLAACGGAPVESPESCPAGFVVVDDMGPGGTLTGNNPIYAKPTAESVESPECML